MATALFLIALGLFNVSAMDVLSAGHAIYCGGASGGGGSDDDPDDNWGPWKGQLPLAL